MYISRFNGLVKCKIMDVLYNHEKIDAIDTCIQNRSFKFLLFN